MLVDFAFNVLKISIVPNVILNAAPIKGSMTFCGSKRKPYLWNLKGPWKAENNFGVKKTVCHSNHIKQSSSN